MKTIKQKTKSNIRKYFSASSVEKFARSLCIGSQESGGHRLKIMDAKLAESNYCTSMFSILCLYVPIVILAKIGHQH